MNWVDWLAYGIVTAGVYYGTTMLIGNELQRMVSKQSTNGA